MAEPGWYEDPTNPAQLRWFDGSNWTDALQSHTAPDQLVDPSPGDLDLNLRASGGLSRLWVGAIAASVVLVVGAAVAVAFAVSGGGGDPATGAERTSAQVADESTLSPTVVGPSSDLEPPGTAPPATPVPTVPPPPAVTEQELRSLVLPNEVCAGLELAQGNHQVVDGAFAEPDGYGGALSILVDETTVGDLDGDGVDDGAISLACANGVADHVDTVRVVLAKDRSQIDVTLTRDSGADASGQDAENLADVMSIGIWDGSLTVTMWWTFLNDPLCCPTTVATGEYRLVDTSMNRSGLTVVDDRARTQHLVDALNAGDRAAVNALVDFADYYESEMDRGVQFSFAGCSAPDPLNDFKYCEMSHTAGDWTYAVEWSAELDSDAPDAVWGTASPMDYGD